MLSTETQEYSTVMELQAQTNTSLPTSDEELNNNTYVGPTDRPEWLTILDQTSTFLMTCNVITLMLAMGAATYWREIWHHVKRPWACLYGMICQFIVLPALGFGLCMGFQLSIYQALSVLILACSPGGAFSNFFTYWVEGDLALSILMTAVSSLLAFGMMPLNLWAYSKLWTEQEMRVPYINVLISLAFVTLPVIVGMIVRHYNRKWANYIEKVCGLIGWIGAVTCGIMLVLIYWDNIIQSSISLLITAALLPMAGAVASYILSKAVCFSHTVCRTIAMETGCQNMVVAVNVMLLSFAHPMIRGQMVIYPVVYGLFQLIEVGIATGIFQLWIYFNEDRVLDDEVKTEIDNTILTSVPVPAHRLSESRIQNMTGFAGTPDVCRLQSQRDERRDSVTFFRYSEAPAREYDDDIELQERDPFITHQSPVGSNELDDPDTWTREPAKLPEVQKTATPPAGLESPFPFYGRPKSPTCFSFPQSPYFDTPKSPKDDKRDSIDYFDKSCQLNDDSLKSPTLSNKGVPYMFPVTEDDFEQSRGSTPVPYGSPLPIQKERKDQSDGNGLSGAASPSSPLSPTDSSKTFGFYHNDVRIGQTDQFSTFGRKK